MQSSEGKEAENWLGVQWLMQKSPSATRTVVSGRHVAFLDYRQKYGSMVLKFRRKQLKGRIRVNQAKGGGRRRGRICK